MACAKQSKSKDQDDGNQTLDLPECFNAYDYEVCWWFVAGGDDEAAGEQSIGQHAGKTGPNRAWHRYTQHKPTC